MYFRDDAELIQSKCKSFPAIGKLIGRGSRGTVYGLISNKSLVAKIQAIDPQNKEIYITTLMSKLGIAPAIHKVYTCKPLGLQAIILNKLGKTLPEWKRGKPLAARRKARVDILKLVQKAHASGWYHGDLHAEQFAKSKGSWYLLDWGHGHQGAGGRKLPWWIAKKQVGGKRDQRAYNVVSRALNLSYHSQNKTMANILNL